MPEPIGVPSSTFTTQPISGNANHDALEATPARPGVWKRLVRQRAVLLAMGWLLVLVIAGILAPFISPYDPTASDVMNRLQGMTAQHWLGTDDLGRDLLSRAIWGARIALTAALQVIVVAAAIGIPIGLLVGYKGGWWDRILMRIVEVEQPIPTLLLVFTFVAIFGRNLSVAMLAISFSFAMIYVRLTRAVVLAERQKAYVQAAEIQGYPLQRILFRHILPNAIGPLMVQTSVLAGMAILLEAMLSFLGMGAPSGTPSWGGMLDDARRFQIQQILLSVVPGGMITATVLAFNLIGDGVRDAFSGEEPPRRIKRQRIVPPASLPEHRLDPETNPAAAVLSVRNLVVEFPREDGTEQDIVKGINFEVQQGEIFGLVGESGSGKSMTASAIFGMVPSPGWVKAGSIILDGRELADLQASQWSAIRGRDIGVVFQDPMASLSPVHTVGTQLIEGLRRHQNLPKAAAMRRAAELLDLVGVPDAGNRLKDYPHQFSGGMAQRAMIAAALACNPKLLIADEPTTALDATVQKQVLELIVRLRDTLGMSVLLITHDLGVVAQVCDRVGVMQHGLLVEQRPTAELFANPRHDYTRQLIEARKALVASDDWNQS